MSRPINYQTVTTNIASGGSLSAAIPVAPLSPIGIVMPAAWDAAPLTFLVSVDDTTFSAMQSMTGEVSASAAAGQYIALNPDLFTGVVSFKIRSGTAGSPVTQTADRALTVVTKV